MRNFADSMDSRNFKTDIDRLQALVQLRAFARQDGALLGLLWAASFACMVWIPTSGLSTWLMLATPFFVGWRLMKFRNYALNGVVSLKRGFAYCSYTFFYASLIFAIMQFVYFKYLDNGNFFNIINNALQVVLPIYRANGINTQQLINALGLMRQLTSMEMVFLFMMQNIIIGLFLSLPVAAICKRRIK